MTMIGSPASPTPRRNASSSAANLYRLRFSSRLESRTILRRRSDELTDRIRARPDEPISSSALGPNLTGYQAESIGHAKTTEKYNSSSRKLKRSSAVDLLLLKAISKPCVERFPSIRESDASRSTAAYMAQPAALRSLELTDLLLHPSCS